MEEKEMMIFLVGEILKDKNQQAVRECHPKYFGDLAITIQAKGYEITQEKQKVYGIDYPFFNFIRDVWTELSKKRITTTLSMTTKQKDQITQELHDKGYRITKEEPVTT